MTESDFGRFYRNLKEKLDEIAYDYPHTEIGKYLELSNRLLDKIYSINYWEKKQFESGINFQDSYSEVLPEYDITQAQIQEMKKFRDFYLELKPPNQAKKYKNKILNVMNALIKEFQNCFSSRSEKKVRVSYAELKEEEENIFKK